MGVPSLEYDLKAARPWQTLCTAVSSLSRKRSLMISTRAEMQRRSVRPGSRAEGAARRAISSDTLGEDMQEEWGYANGYGCG